MPETKTKTRGRFSDHFGARAFPGVDRERQIEDLVALEGAYAGAAVIREPEDIIIKEFTEVESKTGGFLVILAEDKDGLFTFITGAGVIKTRLQKAEEEGLLPLTGRIEYLKSKTSKYHYYTIT